MARRPVSNPRIHSETKPTALSSGRSNAAAGPARVLGSGNAHGRAPCQAEAMVLRCLIVDDSPRFLDAARSLLERQGITVVGVASTSAEALEQAAELRPDVTLVDVELGDESGLELVGQLGRRGDVAPSSLILISAHAEQDYAGLTATSTAAGFLSKSDLSAGAIRDLLGPGADDSLDPVSGPRGK
ncbi:response regulator transcription factor [Pseudonocardia sp.]|uniref:response regulator transcription factor n=1 Tax=Pseudonocardia sp. TaxID=60912 RepID=UPI00262261D6|nr:response regulator transcription factor [Pseudonocardia sp.]